MKASIAAALHRLGEALAPPEEAVIPMPPGLRWTDDEQAREARRRAAVAMLDDETLAALVVMVRDVGPHLEVFVGGEVRREYWPPISQTLAAIERESRNVR